MIGRAHLPNLRLRDVSSQAAERLQATYNWRCQENVEQVVCKACLSDPR